MIACCACGLMPNVLFRAQKVSFPPYGAGTPLSHVSLDRTIRTYTFPGLVPQFVLGAHRAAVNTLSISQNLIVSGSGDRSIRLWDAGTGKLLRTFENHHSRGYVRGLLISTPPFPYRADYSIASIDFRPPYILSGSSDKHVRLFDMTTLQGWSTSPDYKYEGTAPVHDAPLPFPFVSSSFPPASSSAELPGTGGSHVCHACGGNTDISVQPAGADVRCVHGDLVRSVAIGEDFVLSGSYDLSIKVGFAVPVERTLCANVCLVRCRFGTGRLGL